MICFQLFYTFFLIGIMTFGGGYAMIPMIQDTVVGNGWMNLTELTDFIAVSEATPGPFAVNIATFVGNKVGGVFGAICTTLGVVLPSFIIILIVAFVLSKFLKNRYVKGALNGVRPVILALILFTAFSFLFRTVLYGGNALFSQDIEFDRKALCLLLVVSGLLVVYKNVNKKSLNTLSVLLLTAVLGLIIYY